MTEPIQYTHEDRDMLRAVYADRSMLRAVRDALLGTFDRRGALSKLDDVERKIDEHINETHGDVKQIAASAVEVARTVAAEAVVTASNVAARAVSDRESPRKFFFDVAKTALGAGAGFTVVWAIATFALGFKVSIGQ